MNYDEIYQIDCNIGLKRLPSNSIDLIVTSPPYNVGIDYDVYDDNIKWSDYLEWTKKWLKECYRVLKDDGRICINHYINYQRKGENISRFPLMDIRFIQEEIGYNVHKLIIWGDRTISTLTAWGSWKSASAPYISTPYEGILISYKNQWKKLNKGISTISKEYFIEGVSGVWNLGTASNKNNRKAAFPIKLPTMCIELLSYKDDIVLDPFMGSGTTAIACIKTNRQYIGFELSEDYVNTANKRIENVIQR